MKTKDQQALRLYVRAREDFQAMRKSMDNRLGRKANGEHQNINDERSFDLSDVENFDRIANDARQQEKKIEKMLRKTLKRFDIYNNFLKEVKGVAEIAAAHILSEFDIYKATTVSKMWQYAGLNPGLVRGKKRIAKSKYKKEMGEIIDQMKNIKTGETDYIIQTEDSIKGDRATPGYILPYNKNLRTRLFVMGTGFIKAQNSYALEFYYPYKRRLEQSQQMTKEVKKGGKVIDIMWKEATPGHRNQAAIRYMIKMFIKDLYVAWRDIEGLEIREPYNVEYLGNDRH
jgi:hypothetical protein